MASLKEKFLEGCAQTNTTPAVAKQLWEDMEKSQDYSFNKAHAACYALIAYRTAWLRAHHPREYMAALISSVMNTKDRVPVLRQRVSRDGDRGAAARRQLLAVRLRGRRGEDPLRPQRGEERRRQRGARDRRGARAGRAVRVDLGLHRARRPGGREQARARVARQVRRARFHRRSRKGMFDVLEQALGCGQRRTHDALRSRPGLDLRPRLEEPQNEPPSADSRPTSGTRTSCCGWRRRRSASTSPSIRSRPYATSSAARPS